LRVKNFDQLYKELLQKSQDRPAGSATVEALEAGIHSMGKKIIEEAGEVWLAGEHEDNEALSLEISQLLFRLQILMIARGITPDDVYKVL